MTGTAPGLLVGTGCEDLPVPSEIVSATSEMVTARQPGALSDPRWGTVEHKANPGVTSWGLFPPCLPDRCRGELGEEGEA